MRDRQVRLVFLGLILAFPLLLGASSSSGAGPVFGVEAVVVLGLMFASRERRRILALSGQPAAVGRQQAAGSRRPPVYRRQESFARGRRSNATVGQSV